MRRTSSADGTEIAYEIDGSGPPLVLLHGGTGCRRHWDALTPHLVDSFTVIRPDRRGRGDSGDHEEYGLDREVADLRAVLATVDGDATVFGHSFGGLVALAAADDADIDRLVLYEPALLVGEHGDGNLASRMQAHLDAGERKTAMRCFYEESSGLDDVTQVPWWPDEVSFERAETVVRENYAVEATDIDTLPSPAGPTLLLTGEDGPEHLRDAVFALEDRLPDSQVVELEGVGHVGTMLAPKQVADAVCEFIESS
ncbi:alpha/beta fold hydrolase [Natronomonas sp. CBA1123]|uniref:alpha/beta fold hydrolase n=1 Tax=Natronomonas sp. CBA1123 TaxID=2668070 RepID=UPI0012EACEED|nr:alpha/beta hydrolase [Natronomonas sp. CBA1123]MUV86577.1 alpha/beta fold hydrolase [Natronomonas sp. CBA1123]